jgi:hypothetical protein
MLSRHGSLWSETKAVSQCDVVRAADFAAYVNADIAKWKKVITDAKVPLIGG